MLRGLIIMNNRYNKIFFYIAMPVCFICVIGFKAAALNGLDHRMVFIEATAKEIADTIEYDYPLAVMRDAYNYYVPEITGNTSKSAKKMGKHTPRNMYGTFVMGNIFYTYNDYIDWLKQYNKSQTPESVWERGTAVCEGYANTFAYMVNRAHIPGVYAYVVSGLKDSRDKTSHHAWNLLYIDDKIYWCDITSFDGGTGAYNPIYLLSSRLWKYYKRIK